MKILLPLLLLIGLVTGCTKTPEVSPGGTSKVDYDQRSIKIIQEVSPLVAGEWKLREVHVKAQSYNTGQRELGLKRDTVFQNFAVLSIHPGNSGRSIADPRYAAFEGTLRFRTKTYPVRFEISAAPDKLFRDTGPQAVFLLDYNYSPGSHPTDPEESFLQYLGFMRENFSLEVLPGESRMVWRGLNRGIDKIELHK